MLTAAANEKERVGHLKKKGASIEEFDTLGSEKPWARTVMTATQMAE